MKSDRKVHHNNHALSKIWQFCAAHKSPCERFIFHTTFPDRERNNTYTESWIDKLLVVFLLILAAAEGIYVAVLLYNGSFYTYAAALGILLAVGVILGVAGLLVLKSVNKNKTREKQDEKPAFFRYPIYSLFTVLLIIFQIIWNYYMHEPYRETDIMAETVQTMLTAGTLHEINPMTGLAYTAGTPLRLKIVMLPALYACLVQGTGLPVQTVVYEIIPMLMLCLSYLVYSRMAVYLFPEDGKKQCLFVLMVAVIIQFGNYAFVTDAFKMLHMGYDGTGIRAAVILPYAFLTCLQGKWWRAGLCALAEACLVWTMYGLGYTIIIMLVTSAVMLVGKSLRKRRAGVCRNS